ncbi:MAG: hypothetical protein KJ630_03125 [Proteobacteria bacterium]|nr:hypothetical protein [Pseudomonadota bacterium]
MPIKRQTTALKIDKRLKQIPFYLLSRIGYSYISTWLPNSITRSGGKPKNDDTFQALSDMKMKSIFRDTDNTAGSKKMF